MLVSKPSNKYIVYRKGIQVTTVDRGRYVPDMAAISKIPISTGDVKKNQLKILKKVLFFKISHKQSFFCFAKINPLQPRFTATHSLIIFQLF